MTTDKFREALSHVDWRWPVAGLAAVLALILLAALIRRIGKGDAAGKVTALATVLGLGWSAQGMLDTAINRYDQPVLVAAVLFVVFEAWLVGRMLRARQYRQDYGRRGKFVTSVVIGALVMALVVALGEGWAQAPGRLAIPLLVAYGWYTDLTADDDPKAKPKTSWRWTPRRGLLAIGALEPGERDVETIDRDRLRDRLTKLAFRRKHGSAVVNDLFRREVRMSRLKTIADDDDLAAVRTRLARMSVDLFAEAESPAKPSRLYVPNRRIELPGDAKPQGVHTAPNGLDLRGAALHSDGVSRMLGSITPERPKGMTIAELSALYSPPLKTRTAETIAAAARKQINGSPVA